METWAKTKPLQFTIFLYTWIKMYPANPENIKAIGKFDTLEFLIKKLVVATKKKALAKPVNKELKERREKIPFSDSLRSIFNKEVKLFFKILFDYLVEQLNLEHATILWNIGRICNVIR